MSKIILFILTFFTPTGFNYIYLGQKKKGFFFLILYFLVIGIVLNGLFNTTLNYMIIFCTIVSINILIMYDCLSIRKKLLHKIKVEDTICNIVMFCKQNIMYVLLFILFSIAISVVNNMYFNNINLQLIIVMLLKGFLLAHVIFMLSKIFIYISNKDDNTIYKEILTRKAHREASNKLHKTIKDDSILKTLKAGYTNLDTIAHFSVYLENTKIHAPILEIEKTTIKILNFIETQPHKAKLVKNFTSYYLPTTTELINSYYHLYSQNLNGVHINETLVTIENIILNIEKAFKLQLDNLFEDKAINISSEVNVLNSILKSENLI